MLRQMLLMTALFVLHVAASAAAAPTSAAAASLRATHDELLSRLGSSPFGRPLHLDSRESASDLRVDMHAVVDHPFELARTSLVDPGAWCDVLILHLNTKYCRAETQAGQSFLAVNIGRKHDQPLDKTFQVRFAFRVTAATPDYFSVVLIAPSGPYGTSNYRILLEAIPLDRGHAFVHLSYSYGFGMTARLAMQTYLRTIGSAKVGFTATGRARDGDPVFVSGVRGMIERNTMRYYLAVESYLDSLSAPAQVQTEKRLNDWFAAIERYPRQLHELEREDYLAMKRKEIRRQQG